MNTRSLRVKHRTILPDAPLRRHLERRQRVYTAAHLHFECGTVTGRSGATRTNSTAPRRGRNALLGWLLPALVCALTACTQVPEGLQPVKGFEIQKFLGTWYLIAHLDYGFERGLQNVTEVYSESPQGEIVLARQGFDPVKKAWDETRGTVQLAGEPGVGSLKISLFGPLFTSFHIIALDRNYRYAMLSGPTKKYLAILSRESTLPQETLSGLLHQAQIWGFETDQVARVNHTPPELAPTDP